MEVKDFLNAPSSLTFGSISILVVGITTTLCSSFVLPTAIVALLLSTLFAGVIISYSNEKLIHKVWMFPICALLIFHTARGGNTTLDDVSGKSPAPLEIIVSPEKQVSFDPISLFVQSANAEDSNKDQNNKNKFYLYKYNEDGQPIYTNVFGKAYTNASTRLFGKWNWSSKK